MLNPWSIPNVFALGIDHLCVRPAILNHVKVKDTISVHICLQKWVFRFTLKVDKLGEHFTFSGSSLHSTGPALANALSPNDVDGNGSVNVRDDPDRSPDLVGLCTWINSARYVGANPWRTRNINRIILKSTRAWLGNQCSSFKRGVACDMLTARHTTRAAVFWTLWSFLVSFFGRPKRSAFPASSLEDTNECTNKGLIRRYGGLVDSYIILRGPHRSWDSSSCRGRYMGLIKGWEYIKEA